MASEAVYQAKLIKKLERLFPGCYIVTNDPRIRQGIPDLLILVGEQWAMLEVKAAHNSPEQPNQAIYVERFGRMSFAAFICPENEEEVLRDLQSTFGALR